MKICQIADIHQGLGYPGTSPLSRFEDINRVLDWTADYLIAEKVDLVLIAGDCFKDAKVMFDRGADETICIGNWLRKISSAGIEVIVISGTPSHDSIAGYKILKEMQIPNVSIYTQPQIMPVFITGGPGEEDVNVACLPGLNRSSLMTQDEYKCLPPEQVHRIMTDKITQLCQGMAAQMPDDKPKILMSHLTYQGCDSGFQDLLMQHEPILTREATQGFNLICLGHIHRPQVIDSKVFYSGPIERLSFNEEDILPGFWIHDVGVSKKLEIQPYPIYSQFIETPARRYVTLELDQLDMEHVLSADLAYVAFMQEIDLKDSIVRLCYSCSEEVAKQLNRKQLEKALYDAGAFYVSEIKADVQRVDRARDNSVNESLGPLEALDKWAINQGIEESERQALAVLTSELMEG